MWVKISEKDCINLGLAARVVVRETRASDPAADGPAENGARFDVEAHFPDERRHSLASFPVCLDCGRYQAEAKAAEVFARIMRAAGDGKTLLDLTQTDAPRPGTQATTDANRIRFAL